MKKLISNIASWKMILLCMLCTFAALPVFSQAKSVQDLCSEIAGYSANRTKELLAAGKKLNADARKNIEDEKRDLATKYANEVSGRPTLANTDYYYLGLLYNVAGNEEKVIEVMKKFLASYPPDAKGDMIQYARGYVIAESARNKQLKDAEDYFGLWMKGSPIMTEQQPILESAMAAGYYKSGQYDLAVKHAQSAFDLLKTLKPKSPAERRDREQLYMNLIEILALSYKKSKDSERALDVLAEARAQSFAIPSANLYRKVMDFVEGSGFSEKKLMQKVESYASADPAPVIQIDDWLDMDATSLDKLRGKVVLLDFWMTWCGPCISTFPRLRSWYKKYSDKDFVLLGVTQYEGAKEGKRMSGLQELDYLKTFKEKYKMTYPIAIVHPGETSKYGINAFPTTILLDRNGVVRYIGIGANGEESENLENMINKVLKETPGSVAAQ